MPISTAVELLADGIGMGWAGAIAVGGAGVEPGLDGTGAAEGDGTLGLAVAVGLAVGMLATGEDGVLGESLVTGAAVIGVDIGLGEDGGVTIAAGAGAGTAGAGAASADVVKLRPHERLRMPA